MSEQPAQGDDQTPEAPSAGGAAPVSASPAQPRQVTLRRAPRYRAFVVTGVLVGLVCALVLVQIFPDDGQYSTRTVLAYLAATLGLGGGVLGAGLALLVERPRR